METRTQQAAGNAQVIPNQNPDQGTIYSKLSAAHFIIFACMTIFLLHQVLCTLLHYFHVQFKLTCIQKLIVSLLLQSHMYVCSLDCIITALSS